ncbi:unnamed protein product [Bacillus thuringiensis DB27]|uniref:Uncharacterized protein n=1 Tax=Bacillus thuringiensis DB27 TaxID=1431339 RepID=W8Y5G0_BACTU|nr:unnamed protein product [Bacillus thuringiensis DB27]
MYGGVRGARIITLFSLYSIVLLRATEPKYWNEYRNKTAQEIV